MLELLFHSSIKLLGDKIIYIDPFKIENALHDADFIFCTHSHYDHFSIEDILKIKNENTFLIITQSCFDEAIKYFSKEKILVVEPSYNYCINDLSFETTPSYNINKNFHPKANKWVGYIISSNAKTYFIAGDTDNIPEIQNLTCDIAFLPIGGTYTMNYKEAAELANTLNASLIVPTHYGSIVGTVEDAEKFKSLVQNKEVKIILK